MGHKDANSESMLNHNRSLESTGNRCEDPAVNNMLRRLVICSLHMRDAIQLRRTLLDRPVARLLINRFDRNISKGEATLRSWFACDGVPSARKARLG